MLEVLMAQLGDLLSRGWVGVLIGALIAWLAYIKTRNRKRLSWGYSCDELLGLDNAAIPSGLEVRFEDTPIPRLSRTLVFIWNSAEQTIRKDDVVEPIRISVCGDEDKVLRATTLRVTRDICNVKAEIARPDRDDVHVEFAYLDQQDGVVIEILHTGEATVPSISGTIIGIPKGLNRVGSITVVPPPNEGLVEWATRVKLPYYFMVAGGLAFIGAQFYMDGKWREAGVDLPQEGLGSMAFGLLYIVLGALGLFFKRRRHPKNLLVR